MQGKGFTNDGCDTNHKGLQPRVIDYLFHLMNGLKKTEDFEFLIKCNYLEIYNEQIVDLVYSEKIKTKLKKKNHNIFFFIFLTNLSIIYYFFMLIFILYLRIF